MRKNGHRSCVNLARFLAPLLRAGAPHSSENNKFCKNECVRCLKTEPIAKKTVSSAIFINQEDPISCCQFLKNVWGIRPEMAF